MFVPGTYIICTWVDLHTFQDLYGMYLVDPCPSQKVPGTCFLTLIPGSYNSGAEMQVKLLETGAAVTLSTNGDTLFLFTVVMFAASIPSHCVQILDDTILWALSIMEISPHVQLKHRLVVSPLFYKKLFLTKKSVTLWHPQLYFFLLHLLTIINTRSWIQFFC